MTDLVERFASERDPRVLRELVAQFADQMDATFFEELVRKAPREHLIRVAQIHLAHVSPTHLDHLALFAELDAALTEGRLDAEIDRRRDAIDADFVDSVLRAAESALGSRLMPGAARHALDIAGRVIERCGVDTMRATYCLQEGAFFLGIHDPDRAEQILDEGLQAERAAPNPLVREALLVNRGLVHFQAGRFRECAAFYQSVIPQLADPNLCTRARSNLAIAYIEQGLFARALRELEQLASGWDSPEHPEEMARILGNLAMVFGLLGVTDKQQDCLLRSHAFAERPPPSGRTRDWQTLATSFCNLTLFYLGRGQTDEASRWFDAFEQACADLGVGEHDPTRARLALRVRLARGEIEDAGDLARRLFATWEPRSDAESLSLLGTIGEVHLRLDLLTEAERIFRQLLQLAQSGGHAEIEYGAWANLARARLAAGDPEAALQLFEQVFALDDRLRSEIDRDTHQLTFSGTVQRGRTQMQAVQAAVAVGDERRLFDTIQQAKAAALVHRFGAIARFEAVRAALPPRAALLEFFQHEQTSICLVVRADRMQPARVDLTMLDRDVGACCARYHEQLPIARFLLESDPFAMLAPLGPGLIAPLLPLVEDLDHLVIAPSSFAALIPFHLLRLPGGDRLIQRFATSYVPSGTVLTACTKRRRLPRTAFVAAAPRCRDPDEVHDAFAAEATQVAAACRDAGLALINDHSFPATRATVLKAASHADVLHVAAHGHFSEDDPLGSGLELDGDGGAGLVTVDDLADQSFVAELAFFSGCETGRAQRIEGQEQLGIMTMLLMRGANNAILSHWPILASSPTTGAIIRRFYEGWLSQGLSKAVALQRAVAPLIDTASVYDWAGYSLFGAGL